MAPRSEFSRSRRDLLKGLTVASVGLGSLAPGLPAAASTADLDLSSPEELLRASVRMRGSLDGRLAFIWTRGLRYTLVDGAATPLCGYLGGSITRYRQLADDAWEFLLYEVSYYTDLETGEVLRQLRMPHSNKVVDVPLYRTGPGRHVLMMSNHEEMEWNAGKTTSEELAKQLAPEAKIYYQFDLRPAVTFEDTVWIRSDSFTRLAPNDPSVKPMFYKESITYQSTRQDMARRDSPSAGVSLSFAIATAWRPWMQMDGIPGHTVTDGVGGKVHDIREMPGDFLRFSERHHPDVLDDPEALLAL